MLNGSPHHILVIKMPSVKILKPTEFPKTNEAILVSVGRNFLHGGSSCGKFCILRLGVPRTLVGIGADAAPAGQRPGPILSPGADFSSFTSEPDLARTRAVIIE